VIAYLLDCLLATSDLSWNLLEGQLPNLGLPDVQSLYLGNNRFTGTIPKQLRDADDLAEMYATHIMHQVH
jgi:hypothetical protein